MRILLLLAVFTTGLLPAADFTPAPQKFRQEVTRAFTDQDGLTSLKIQLIESAPNGVHRAFAGGKWHELRDGRWQVNETLAASGENVFVFADAKGQPVQAPVPWRDVRQILRTDNTDYVAASHSLFAVKEGKASPLGWPADRAVNQIALSPSGALVVASSEGLIEQKEQAWVPLQILDRDGRAWAVKDALGVAFDSQGRLWFATRAGAGCRTSEGWKFYEGKDGLPWNDFTCITAAPDGEIWFGTRLGAIRFDGRDWQYREGKRWLPHDEVAQIAVDAGEKAWVATAGGVGLIERRAMTLAAKAEFYEEEIEKYIKRTQFGFVAEAALRKPGDKSSADPQDSDNDGLWTAMYGAGECFAYAATKDPKAKERAKKAFEALRFLQKVTQGGKPAPPKGYIARTIRPIEWPDPNIGRLEHDRREHEGDKLWKVYEPRWPRSADGKWFWKSDTSSDELDGHYFFYPLYYDLCADTDSERERLREVVRDITDHLLTHNYVLIDHDGLPTRWAIYGPQFLNHDPNWWPERGLNSLSILSYLAVAEHVTGDPKYAAASRELIVRHSYAHNLMYAKVQHGPGSGNQSDDEMGFMSFYSLLHCSKDQKLKTMVHYSFFRYWVNEAPEMNPFFNFAYASQNSEAKGESPWGSVPLRPWPGWHEDSMATLYGFPLDRLDWPLRNSHRLDVVALPRVRSRDLDEPDARKRGHRVGGKVIPVENRHFGHWNTDPWQLDYGGNGGELGAGTVFLLPYYMGLYHGFIEKP
jgi:hypothetical protein